MEEVFPYSLAYCLQSRGLSYTATHGLG